MAVEVLALEPRLELAQRLRVARVGTGADLDALASEWNALAGERPFRRWEWIATWWECFGAEMGRKAELFVLTVRDADGRLVGIAPWYMQHTPHWGRVIRFIGSGKVCSEYLSIFCHAGTEPQIAAVLAEWLLQAAIGKGEAGTRRADRWDLLDLDSFTENDPVLPYLVQGLQARRQEVTAIPGDSCWRISLPENWTEYEATLSKSHRKQVRRLDKKMFGEGVATLHTAMRPDELKEPLRILFELHQKRRKSLGERGCFDDPTFERFLILATYRFASEGRVRLHWIEVNGKVVAADYHLIGDRTTFAYQGGVDPEALDCEPGRLITIATLRKAMEEGQHEFDLLRGNEPYKAHWRAVPLQTVRLRIVPPLLGARIRNQLWRVCRSSKAWLKKTLLNLGSRQQTHSHAPPAQECES